jgi:phospholipid/cholesterol/gamma-HCH transport system permease protein
MTEPSSGRGWIARVDQGATLLSLTQDWTTGDAGLEPGIAATLLARPGIQALRFDTRELGRWDSSLLVFLAALRAEARLRHVDFDEKGLPAAAQQLLALLPEHPPVPPASPPRIGMVEGLGRWVIGNSTEVMAFTTLVGDTILRTAAAIRGRARMRLADLFARMQEAGIEALPMVALVNVLVGGIVAFVGAVQLRRFGAGIYIANLIGVAEVREMAPLMTAIVMSGRTGSAYAAELATMQGSEEIDALRAFGIPIVDYLVLPRVTALTAMMPVLNLYAGALGILGGFTVAVVMMKIPPAAFVAQIRGAVTAGEIFFGLAKAAAFGAWIGTASCRIGLHAGRSATDVGQSATAAAVSGIVGVIALDAVFDVCADALGI